MVASHIDHLTDSVTGMNKSPDSIAINGAALRHIRRITGVGVNVLAGEIGVSAPFISMIESGRRPRVSPEVFASLCSALLIEDRRALMARPDVLVSEDVPA